MSTEPHPNVSPYPTISEHNDHQSSYPDNMSIASSSSSISEHEQSQVDPMRLVRPRLGSRKSSGTIIIPRDSVNIELENEEYDDDDARTMSPRRSSEEIEQMGRDARRALIEQAKALQASLMEIVDRVEVVRNEHEKLEGGNKFLQSYIGELMQTSKITSAGAAKNSKKQGQRTKYQITANAPNAWAEPLSKRLGSRSILCRNATQSRHYHKGHQPSKPQLRSHHDDLLSRLLMAASVSFKYTRNTSFNKSYKRCIAAKDRSFCFSLFLIFTSAQLLFVLSYFYPPSRFIFGNGLVWFIFTS